MTSPKVLTRPTDQAAEHDIEHMEQTLTVLTSKIESIRTDPCFLHARAVSELDLTALWVLADTALAALRLICRERSPSWSRPQRHAIETELDYAAYILHDVSHRLRSQENPDVIAGQLADAVASLHKVWHELH